MKNEDKIGSFVFAVVAVEIVADSFTCLIFKGDYFIELRKRVCTDICYLIDGYLLVALFLAAFRSDIYKNDINIPGQWFELVKKNLPHFFPIRTVAVPLLICFFIALVLSFATLYKIAPLGSFNKSLKDPWDALYFSFVTIATVGFGDYAPVCRHEKQLVMCEIMSGLLLFIGAFPLLVSRIADYGSVTAKRDR